MASLGDDVFKLLGVQLDASQLAAFDRYARELAEWNQRFNLTTITDPAQVRVKHFLDSLSCWLGMRGSLANRVMDVGSGAGFPGLVLKILRPAMPLTLVESTRKKASFLEHMVQVLYLRNVEIIAKRTEEIGQLREHRESYDWTLARAV